jgi:hypothetical protein
MAEWVAFDFRLSTFDSQDSVVEPYEAAGHLTQTAFLAIVMRSILRWSCIRP